MHMIYNRALENMKELVVQVEEWRADVRRVQSDVTEIKAQLVRINTRCDSLECKLDKLKDSLTTAMLAAIYVTGWGTMLYVLAKGFKWI